MRGRSHPSAIDSGGVDAKRVEQLQDNLAAADLILTAGEIVKLDTVSALPPEYPGWMLTLQGAGRPPAPFKP